MLAAHVRTNNVHPIVEAGVRPERVMNDSNRTPAAIVSSVRHLNRPDQVAFLSTRGQVLGEYWHPGHLNILDRLISMATEQTN